MFAIFVGSDSQHRFLHQGVGKPGLVSVFEPAFHTEWDVLTTVIRILWVMRVRQNRSTISKYCLADQPVCQQARSLRPKSTHTAQTSLALRPLMQPISHIDYIQLHSVLFATHCISSHSTPLSHIHTCSACLRLTALLLQTTVS